MSYSEGPKYDDGSKFRKYFGIALVVIVIAVGAYVYKNSNLNLSLRPPTEHIKG